MLLSPFYYVGKHGVLEFIDVHIMNLERSLDIGWIADHPKRIALTAEA